MRTTNIAIAHLLLVFRLCLVFHHCVTASKLDGLFGSVKVKIRPSQRRSAFISSGFEILQSIERGGSSETAKDPFDESDHCEEEEADATNSATTDKPDTTDGLETNNNELKPNKPAVKRKVRHTSDLVLDLMDQYATVDEESKKLRMKITERCEEFLVDLVSAERNGEKIPSPMKVLHNLAPKIPAIKQSPDFMLRIESAKGDIDSGVAASVISSIARLCVLYDKEVTDSTIFSDIVKDRRFEQLVECVLCGIDVRYRKKQAKQMEKKKKEEDGLQSKDIEEVLDEEDVKIGEGLSVKDACRAAWGLGVLGGHQLKPFRGQQALDILTALSLRTRERLLARLQMIRNGELITDASTGLTLAERFDKDAENLAEHAVKSMWAFSCVKACTGLRSVALLETCCSILCQNPTELRQRASAQKTGFDDLNFEDNEIVERLALSEESEEVEDSLGVHDAEEGGSGDFKDEPNEVESDDKDALLDWLSSTEKVDIMWALAVHGSTDEAESKQELTLSETAAALREIAFDRIECLLREDIAAANEAKTSAFLNSPPPIKTEYVSNEEGMVVEVIDAAAVLAMEQDNAENEAQVIAAIHTDTPEAIQVVDAATLLAAEGVEDRSSVETEIIVTSSSIGTTETTLAGTPSGRGGGDYCFSNNDLCSIAWAVTDLRDSLRPQTIDLITELFAIKGASGIQDLRGVDLANLVWALAKRTTDEDFVNLGKDHLVSVLHLTIWISERAWDILAEASGSNIVNSKLSLEYFQPPELGRILWSLAMCLRNISTKVQIERVESESFARFGAASLKAADEQTGLFATEDLARIVWGFLELCNLESELEDTQTASSLGRLQSVMETSILKWESGQCEIVSSKNVTQVDDSNPFASFLGRSRFSLRLLEQRLSHTGDDEEDLSSASAPQRSRPLIRDLSLDPASLCKLAYGFSRVEKRHPEFIGAWTFVRIAVRLLCAKNRQLLKESEPADIVRLCFGCAANEAPGYGREYTTRLFARKVVQHFNELLESSSGSVTDRLKLSPKEASTLVWSLGELGVKYTKSDDNKVTAFKRLLLVTEAPLISPNATRILTPKALSRLLHGAVAMNIAPHDPWTLKDIVTNLQNKFNSTKAGVNMVDLADSLSKALNTLEVMADSLQTQDEMSIADSKKKDNSGGDAHVDESDETELHNVTLVDEESENGTELLRPDEESAIDRMTDKGQIISETQLACKQLLAVVAEHMAAEIPSLPATMIRKILSIYFAMPFEAENLFARAEEEVESRLEQISNNVDISKVTERTSSANPDLDNPGDEKIKNPIALIRDGLFGAMFGKEEEEEAESEESLEQVAELLAEVGKVNQEFLRFKKATLKDAGQILSAEQRGSAFELGRCQYLIASYRRINFATGERTNRYDNDRRKSIQKRTLSRMLL